MFLSDENLPLEILDFTIRSGSTPTSSYFYLYLYAWMAFAKVYIVVTISIKIVKTLHAVFISILLSILL